MARLIRATRSASVSYRREAQLHPKAHALRTPDKPAYIMAGSDEVVTYGQLEARSNQGAQLFRSLGLAIGDTVALFMDNHPRYFEVAWAAQRSGLYFVCLSSRLKAEEAEYILRDSGAKAIISSPAQAEIADQLSARLPGVIHLSVGGSRTSCQDFEALRRHQLAFPIKDERAGVDMLYTSGTTGRPKGVSTGLPPPDLEAPNAHAERSRTLYGMSDQTIYLSPAPLYHAAPLRWTMAVHRLGGTVIVMESFDPQHALDLIAKYRVTHSQWVPTHFVRLLKLDTKAREQADISSMRVAVHAAAPCPRHIKEQMMAWWGPVLYEYYGGTEGAGITMIGPEDWLAHPGSVGKAIVGSVRICGADGEPLPPGNEGQVYFADGPDFKYHNDPEKTAETRNRHGWRTLGDIGFLDGEGYLYLTDRKSFMIISGGVNIYPQEIENTLLQHPAVRDAAVIGVPDEEMGERVVAIVEPTVSGAAGAALAEELMAFVRSKISGVKAPRQIEFRDELPREPTGKLFKRLLRDEYAARTTAKQ